MPSRPTGSPTPARRTKRPDRSGPGPRWARSRNVPVRAGVRRSAGRRPSAGNALTPKATVVDGSAQTRAPPPGARSRCDRGAARSTPNPPRSRSRGHRGRAPDRTPGPTRGLRRQASRWHTTTIVGHRAPPAFPRASYDTTGNGVHAPVDHRHAPGAPAAAGESRGSDRRVGGCALRSRHPGPGQAGRNGLSSPNPGLALRRFRGWRRCGRNWRRADCASASLCRNPAGSRTCTSRLSVMPDTKKTGGHGIPRLCSGAR